MASNFAFSVLNVGQGSGNFVEIFAKDGDTIPTTTVLIDLGSEGASRSHHGPSVERVVASLNSMTAPEIACLCLSHSDTDHISMIEQLLSQFDKPGTKKPKNKILTIKSAFYGGNYALFAKGKRENVIDLVDGYMLSGTNPKPITTNFSSYALGKKPVYEDVTLDFRIKILIGNTIKAAKTQSNDIKYLPLKDAVVVNTVSLIAVFEWSDVQMITTGDATGITMLRANQQMGTGPGSFFTDPLMLTIPHHGSFTTAMAFTGQRIRGIDKKVEQISLFARRCGAKLLTASAGNESQFLHPSAYILNLFWKFASDVAFYQDPSAQPGAHFYTAYFESDDGFKLTTPDGRIPWPSTAGWYTVQSPVQMFTTDYFVQTKLTAYEEEAPKPVPPAKKRKAPTPKMAMLPASPAQPSPGSVVDLPAAKHFPPAEVGWKFIVDENKKVQTQRIDPTKGSIVSLHAIVDSAERYFGLAAATRTPARPTRPTDLPPRRPRAAPAPGGNARPKLKRV